MHKQAAAENNTDANIPMQKRRNTVFSTGALIALLGSRATPSQSATCGAVAGDGLSAPATFPRRLEGETRILLSGSLSYS